MRGPVGRLGALLGAIGRGTAVDGLPYKLTLILTRRCPTRCSFCSIWETPSPDEMSPEEWARVFDSVPGAVWANLSGGEIFQRPDLPAILDALVAKLKGLYLVDFPTTGYFPDRLVDACERLVRGGVRRVLVTISLDGPPALHDRMRGREGAHARACEAMRALRSARLPRVQAFFGTTLFPENTPHVEETIAAAREAVPGLRESDFHFNLGMESGHYYRNAGRGVRAPAEALDVLARHGRGGVHPIALLEQGYRKRVAQYMATGRSPVPCAALRASVFIDPQGVIYPCTIDDRPLGSLRDVEYDVGRILRSAAGREARTVVVEDRCPGCWSPCEAYQSLLEHYRPRLRAGSRAAAPMSR